LKKEKKKKEGIMEVTVSGLGPKKGEEG